MSTRSSSLLSMAILACFLRTSMTPLMAAPTTADAQKEMPEKIEETVFLQLINATSVEKISLGLNGKPLYPTIRQGQWVGAKWNLLSARYDATDATSGAMRESPPFKFIHNSSQSLVIMGDFSTDSPPDILPQSMVGSGTKYPPNVLFKIYPFEPTEGEKSLRYRFVNAMPRTTLKIGGSNMTPTAIEPGEDVVIGGQLPSATYQAVIAGANHLVEVAQINGAHNALIIFYLKEGKPIHQVILQDQ